MNYDYEQSRKILREYFSDIVYIDNQFDTELVDTSHDIIKEDEISEEMPLDINTAESNYTDSTSVDEKQEKESSGVLLMNVMEKLNQEEFSDITLTPILFDDDVTEQLIIKKMRKAHLTIIDWDLGNDRKALPIVKKMLDEVGVLKVVVVYTNGFLAACNSVEEVFGNVNYIRETNKIKCLQYKSKSLVFIVDRQYMDIKKILNEIEDIFIQENGIMPVAVLDIASEFQKKSGDIFGSFCKPVEDVYFLQMFYSEVREHELPNYLTDFIMRKINSDVHVNKALGKELIKSKKEALIKVLLSTDIVALVKECVEELRVNASGEMKSILVLQAEIEKENFETIAHNLEKKQEKSWGEIISSFKPMYKVMEKKYKKEEMQKFLGDNIKDFEEKYKVIYKTIETEITEKIRKTFDTYKKDVMPIFLQMLIAKRQLLESLPELVGNLKYHRYEKVELDDLREGIELDGYARRKFLMNKIHFGDILRDSKANEYFLCITPPCDSFRPQKVEYKYTFIRGKRIEGHEVGKNRKENIHITVYPMEKEGQEDKKKDIYIRWALYELVTFDLNSREQYEKLCEYKRYYQLDEVYTRQIANKFISHFSRAGVDEIFIKNEENLVSLFG